MHAIIAIHVVLILIMRFDWHWHIDIGIGILALPWIGIGFGIWLLAYCDGLQHHLQYEYRTGKGACQVYESQQESKQARKKERSKQQRKAGVFSFRKRGLLFPSASK